jgi:hypothetical protein
MTREIFYVDDINVAHACIAFAEQLNFSVSPNICDLEEGMYLTTGSKNFDVNWIRNDEYAAKQASGMVFDLLEDGGVNDFIRSLVDAYVPDTDHDEVNLHEPEPELPQVPDADTICALYNKVRSQKKSPTRYHVTLKDGNWVATTTDAESYGNLALLFVTSQN